MPQLYTLSDLKKMNMGEISQLIGYDYRDFMQAGGNLGDVLLIANDRKTVADIIGTPVREMSSRGLSDEDLAKIRNRPSSALSVAITTFGIITFIFVFYFVVSVTNIPDPVTLALALLIPVAFVIWRSRKR